MWQLAFSVAFSSIIAWAGYRGRSLSPSGVVGAIIVGTLTFGLGGWTWGLLMIAFFISSSFLSRYRKDDKRGLAEKFAKTGQRDLGQALANGGWGAILAIAYSCRPDPILFAAFVGAMAALKGSSAALAATGPIHHAISASMWDFEWRLPPALLEGWFYTRTLCRTGRSQPQP